MAVVVPAEVAAPYRVLVPALPWSEGTLAPAGSTGRTDGVSFSVVERRDSLCALRVAAPDAECALDALARAGFPVLGDEARGGAAVAGGLRVRAERAPEPDDWWPRRPPWVAWPGAGGEPPDLRISPAAGRALERGHPWLRLDPGCDDPSGFAPGTLVRLRAAGRPHGRCVGLALVEGGGEIGARMWAPGVSRPRDAPSVEARVARALAARRALLDGAGGEGGTDVHRLIHGEADGLPGCFVDRVGPLLRAVTTSRVLEPFRERLFAALRAQLAAHLGPDPPLVEVLCLRPEPAGRLVSVRRVSGPVPDEPLWVRERGLAFRVESGLGRPDRPRPGFGLFPDMRANRERAAQRARGGGRWLNLFAHTGAFSVALLAAGASHVVSVDLSAPYLETLEANRERNGLPPGRHESVRSDVRRFLEALSPAERFAGIVLDPPTAAAAGRRFWSVTHDLEPMVGLALAHLEPGGWLLVARNDRTGRGGARRLDRAVQRAAGRSDVALETVEDAPAGPDFPLLPAFPEGNPFRAIWVRRASRPGVTEPLPQTGPGPAGRRRGRA